MKKKQYLVPESEIFEISLSAHILNNNSPLKDNQVQQEDYEFGGSENWGNN